MEPTFWADDRKDAILNIAARSVCLNFMVESFCFVGWQRYVIIVDWRLLIGSCWLKTKKTSGSVTERDFAQRRKARKEVNREAEELGD